MNKLIKYIFVFITLFCIGNAYGQEAPIKRKSYIDEQPIYSIDPVTPRTDYVSGIYRKVDGNYYERRNDGTVVCVTCGDAATVTNANNGLILSGATVQLGDSLIQNTTIYGAGFDFSILGDTYIKSESSGIPTLLSIATATAADQANFVFGPDMSSFVNTGDFILLDIFANPETNGAYEVTAVNSNIITVEYENESFYGTVSSGATKVLSSLADFNTDGRVTMTGLERGTPIKNIGWDIDGNLVLSDTASTGILPTYNNGLTLLNDAIKLGGMFLGNTAINQSDFDFNLSSIGNNYHTTKTINNIYGRLQIGDSNVTGSAASNSIGFEITDDSNTAHKIISGFVGNEDGITLRAGQTSVNSVTSEIRFLTAATTAATATVGDVWNITNTLTGAGEWDTRLKLKYLNNGLTMSATGDTLQLGGTLTKDTEIDHAGNDLTFYGNTNVKAKETVLPGITIIIGASPQITFASSITGLLGVGDVFTISGDTNAGTDGTYTVTGIFGANTIGFNYPTGVFVPLFPSGETTTVKGDPVTFYTDGEVFHKDLGETAGTTNYNLAVDQDGKLYRDTSTTLGGGTLTADAVTTAGVYNSTTNNIDFTVGNGTDFSAALPAVLTEPWRNTDGTLADSSSTDIKYTAGNITVSDTIYLGGVMLPSDAKLKKNISKIENASLLLSQISGYSYQLKKDNNKQLGVIAQEVKIIIPEAVGEHPTDNHLVVNYTMLIPLLIEAVNEQSKIIKQLQENEQARNSTNRVLKKRKRFSFRRNKKK